MNEQPEKLSLTSMSIVDDRIESMRKIFPEVFNESRIDFAALQRLLGNWIDTGKERFGLNWQGKSECIKVIQQPSIGTLLPMRDKSVNFDSTENIIIEGDNLETLKLLQKSYYSQIKLIYIDPPYNTGNEFIYPDSFHEGLQDYLKYSGQVDAEGFKASTNTETDGRYHSNWLNMMYSRLFLARNLLREDGLIFVSIDDNEIHNLKELMNEIFGEENFVSTLIWKSRQIVDSRSQNGVSNDHEYILIYSKSDFGKVRGKEIDQSKYTNPDNDPRGPWMSNSILGLATQEQRPNLHYKLTDPLTNFEYDCPKDTGWRYSKDTMAAKIKEGRIVFPKKSDGRPREKKFQNELNKEFTGFSSILDQSVGYTLNGTREVRDILEMSIFQFPKPVSLLKALIQQGCHDKDGIILDFFAGSGTTAQAVMELNKEDGGNRKFILVQLPEKTYNEKFPTIADITRERVNRAINKIKDQISNNFGFKYYKLAASNFKVWAGNVSNEKTIDKTLELFVEHINTNRNAEDILYELLLKSGYPLTAPVEKLNLINKDVYSISEGALLICLDRNLSLEVIEAMLQRLPAMIICLDEGFKGNDQLKVNALQTLKSHNQNTESSVVFRVV